MPTPAGGTATKPVEDDDTPAHDQRSGVRLRIDPAAVEVDPGGAAVVRVVVENTGTRVEQLDVGVDGPARAFARAEPPTLSVYPGASAETIVTFRPVRGPAHLAGPTPYRVEARSAIHPVGAGADGVVTVTPFVAVAAALEPEVTRGRRAGRHTVLVANNGNAPADATVALADRDGVLTFTPDEAALTVPPGARLPVATTVAGPRKVFGRATSHQFTATVTPPPGQPPLTVNGVRRQKPLLPWWIPPAALVLVAALFALVTVLGQSKVPATVGLAEDEAVAGLRAAGYDVEVRRLPDQVVPRDQAIGTEPKAGATLKKGSLVVLIMSTGPCAGECPIPIPSVQGLPRAQARGLLEQAGFRIDREVRVDDPAFPKGIAIRTDPPTGTPLARGSGIVLTVSKGAPPKVVVLPDVAGLPRQEAFNRLVALKVRVSERLDPASTQPRGFAAGTDPAAGSSVNEGARITLIVSDAAPPEFRRATTTLVPNAAVDMETGAVADAGADLFYRSDEVVELQVRNGATFALARSGTKSNFAGCRTVALGTAPIPVNELSERRVICLRTDQGRLSVIRIDGPGAGSGEIAVSFVTYEPE